MLHVWAEGKEVNPTLVTTMNVLKTEGVEKSEGNRYILQNGAEATITISVSARNLTGSDYLEGIYSGVSLGYFDEQNNIITTESQYGGVEARIVEDNTYWQDTEFVNSNTNVEDDRLTNPNKIFRNTLRLDFNPDKRFENGSASTTYSYTIKLKFLSNTRENTSFVLETFVGYHSWVHNQVAKEVKYETKSSIDNALNFINSNLKWEMRVETLTGVKGDVTAPTLWKEYNYQDFLVTLENTSEQEEPYFDEFEYTFRLPYDYGLNGVIDSEMKKWLYDNNEADVSVVENVTQRDDNTKLYIGKYNQGGLLVYDVTDKSIDEIKTYKNLGKTFPYTYTDNGIGGIRIKQEDGGSLYSKIKTEKDPTKKSYKTLLIRIPFPNNFIFQENEEYKLIKTTILPTVYFGTPIISMSKDTPQNIEQYFKKAHNGGSIVKEVQTKKMYAGIKGYYVIKQMQNLSNYPVYEPYIIDTLPEEFEITDIEWNTDPKDCVVSLAFQTVEETPEVKWVSLPANYHFISKDNHSAWRLSGIDSFIKEYLTQHSDITFLKQVKVEYKNYSFNENYALDGEEVDQFALKESEYIEGEVRVYGVPQKAIEMTNEVALYLENYFYQELSQTSKRGWVHKATSPCEASAKSLVDNPVVEPQITVLAHTKTQVNELKEQHGENITLPIDTESYYTYEIKNNSEYTDFREGNVIIELNNTVRSTDKKPHGFKPSRLVIPSDYKEFLSLEDGGEIVNITVKDTEDDSNQCEFTIDEAKRDLDGNYYFDSGLWEAKGIHYPKEFVLSLTEIPSKQVKDTTLTLTLYGSTDWYTYWNEQKLEDKNNPKQWEKLTTKGSFVAKVIDSHTVSSTATQDVPVPRVALSVDYEPYYEHEQGEESGIATNLYPYSETLQELEAYDSVDQKRSYLTIPYEKEVTQRFSLFQTSISKADEFTAEIEFPIKVEDGTTDILRGFHALQVKIDGKFLLNNTFCENLEIQMQDATDENKIVKLQKCSDSAIKIIDSKQQEYILEQSKDGNLVISRELWEKWGIDTLKSMLFTGKNFVTQEKNILGDIWVTGFSDSDFSSDTKGYAGGYNDIIKTKSDVILRGQDTIDKDKRQILRVIDEGRLLISRMYFDLQVETGYITKKDQVANKGLRYSQTGISKEHVRIGRPVDTFISSFNDQAVLEVGYKGLVSIGVDFRQYLNDYKKGKPVMSNEYAMQKKVGKNGHGAMYAEGDYAPDIVAGETPLDWDKKQYVESYAYNTKSKVAIQVPLPVNEGFEPYYLKIDPRAVKGDRGQQYIESITITRNNGEEQEIKGEELISNTSSWNKNETENTWYRINLLTRDQEELFTTETVLDKLTPYYRPAKEDMDKNIAVKEISIVLNINQEDEVDGKAAEPDFGTWVTDGVRNGKSIVETPENQHMFEVVGRANVIGNLTAQATAQLTIGEKAVDSKGRKNPNRITDKNPVGKTNWSLKNYYRQWWWANNHWTYYTVPYTAADLYSSAVIKVVEQNMLESKHGIDNAFIKSIRLNYQYGSENPYNMIVIKKKMDYESYVDKAILTQIAPPLTVKTNTEREYFGFKPTKYLIRKDAVMQIDTIQWKDKKGNIIHTLKRDDILTLPIQKETYGTEQIEYYGLSIFYRSDVQDKEKIEMKIPQDIVIEGDNFIHTIETTMIDIEGDGDYASEIVGHERTACFDNQVHSLFSLYGNVNVLDKQEVNGLDDGISKINLSIANKGGTTVKQETLQAIMKAFKIPLKVSSILTKKDNIKSWDYEVTENEYGTKVAVKPTISQYTINLKNDGKKGLVTTAGDTYHEATVKAIGFKQALPAQYRLTTVSIPEELVTGKGILQKFVLHVGTKEEDVLNDFQFDAVSGNYVLDVSKLFQQKRLDRTTVTHQNIDFQAEKIDAFSVLFEVKDGLEAEEELLVGKDDIIFGGSWVDRTQEFIDKDEWTEDSSTPTVGKLISAYEAFSTYVVFPPRTDWKIDTSTFGTENPVVTKNEACPDIIYNRVSGIDGNQVRGSLLSVTDKDGVKKEIPTIGYDDYETTKDGMKTKQMIPVDRDKLYPGDRIEYELVVTSLSDKVVEEENIPLKNPEIHFKAPQGTRIVGWKFENATEPVDSMVGKEQQLKDKNDFLATVYEDNQNGIELEGGIIQDEIMQKKTNYKSIIIKTKDNRYVSPKGTYTVRVYLEMINDYADGLFEGKLTRQFVYIGAKYRHYYSSYYVIAKNINAAWHYCSDKKANSDQVVAARTNMADFLETQKKWGVQITGTLCYYTDTIQPTMQFVYDNPDQNGLEKADVQLVVDQIANYPVHSQSEIVIDVDFIKREGTNKGKQYFYLTQKPSIQYFAPLEKTAKLYYKTKISEHWIKWEDTSTILENTLLKNITQLRWVYEDIPAYQNIEVEEIVRMPKVILKGVGYYLDERVNKVTEKQPNYSTMSAYLSQQFIHIHKEQPIEEVTIARENRADQKLYRLKPNVEINLQAFNTEDEAKETYVPMPTNLKLGYRPKEKFWYRLVVNNEKKATDNGTGAFLKPIVYDKIPIEYLDRISDFQVFVVKKEQEAGQIVEKREMFPKEIVEKIVSEKEITGLDIGGNQSFTYITDDSEDAKPIDIQNNPLTKAENSDKNEISYAWVTFDFSKIDFNLERDQRLEIIYQVQAHEHNLPLAKWKHDGDMNGRQVYLPRFGEYGRERDVYSQHIRYVTPQGNTDIDVRNKMMDLDLLIHEFGVTGQPNEHMDPLEFLNGSTTYIPGATMNGRGIEKDNEKSFFGRNLNASEKQKVSIGMTNATVISPNDMQKVSNNTRYTRYQVPYAAGLYFGNEMTQNRSYYDYLMKERIQDTIQTIEGVTQQEEERNIIWAQHNLHLQKAWLGAASEIVASKNPVDQKRGKYYESGKDITQMVFGVHAWGYYDEMMDWYAQNDQNIPAIEWKETITSRLYAINYGDWDVDGIEFIYVFPKGIRPVIDDAHGLQLYSYNGTYKKNGIYNAVEMTDVEEWDKLPMDNVSYEIIQEPSSAMKTSPSKNLVDIKRNIEGEDRYDEAGWVIKVTVDEKLKKWWNRKSETGYILAIDIPSYIYDMPESSKWYDRLYVSPIEKEENAYSQIYDNSYQLNKIYTGVGKEERFDLDTGGMDDYYKCTYYGHIYPHNLIAPPGFYANGYNVQINRVTQSSDPHILLEKEYAQVGNMATIKKPFLRYWADVGERDEKGGLSETSYYVEKETDTVLLNLHVENRYYAAEYPYTTQHGNGKSGVDYSYQLEDGGARGSFFAPVLTVELPYGMMPLAEDGTWYSQTKDAKPTKEDKPNEILWSLDVKQWDSKENLKKGNTQTMYPVPTEQLIAQNLTKSALTVKVDFDEVRKQYTVRLSPKETTEQNVIALLNEQMLNVSIPVVAYDYGEAAPLEEQKKESWDEIFIKLQSDYKNFAYCSDNSLSSEIKNKNNPYQVLSRRILCHQTKDLGIYHDVYGYQWGRFSVDPRLDSIRYIKVDTTQKEKDRYAVPEEKLLVQYRGVALGKMQLEDEKVVSYHYPMIQEEKEYGLKNSIRLGLKKAFLVTDIKVSDSKTEEGKIWEEDSHEPLENPVRYGDDIWYTVSLMNKNVKTKGVFDAEKSTLTTPVYRPYGNYSAVKNATYTMTLYLPKELSYDDTLDNKEDDKYAEYFIDLQDENGQKYTFSMNELKNYGWKVEIKTIGVNEKKQQIVRATIVTGKLPSKVKDIQEDGNSRNKGELKYGEILSLHIKTRVCDVGKLQNDTEYFIPESTTVYTNVHGLKGEEIEFSTLKPIAFTPSAYAQDIEAIQMLNRLDSEEIRVDGEFDYDQDGRTSEGGIRNLPEEYSYDKAVSFKIKSTHIDVRTNTERPRRIFPPEPITGEIPSRDAIFKLAEKQILLLNQAVVKNGNTQKLLFQYNIPYRSKATMSTKYATKDEFKVKTMLHSISTGKWEVPVDAKEYVELKNNLRVYLYIKEGNAEETYSEFTDDMTDWILLNPKGDTLEANNTYTIPEKQRSKIKQILLMVGHKDDPVHYPIPEGFRLDVDADPQKEGKQEINEIDPPRGILKEGLHGEKFSSNLSDNSVRIVMETDMMEQRGKNQFLNYFVYPYTIQSSQVDQQQDVKYRAGYEVVAELPYMDLFEETKYLGKNGKKYTWTSNNIYDLDYSAIVKHKVALLNTSTSLLEQYGKEGEEDVLTNPNITIGLPSRENITKDEMIYVPFEEMGETPLEESYEAQSSKEVFDLEKQLYWTIYIEDENGTREGLLKEDEEYRGNIYLSYDGNIIFTKKNDEKQNERNVLIFQFQGKLRPGQRVVVEYLSKLNKKSTSQDAIDFQTKYWAGKEGSFLQSLLPTEEIDESGIKTLKPSKVSVRSDRFDVNNNRNINEVILELYSIGGSLKERSLVVQRKKATSDLNQIGGEQLFPIPVQEGGYYTYISGVQSLNILGKPERMSPVLFDILPYVGDEQIVGAQEQNYEVSKRNSKWSGWLVPESLELVVFGKKETTDPKMQKFVVPKEEYDVYVGPIVEKDGKYAVISSIPTAEIRSESEYYNDINKNGQNSQYLKEHFVSLNELLQKKPDNYDELVKAIRMIVVKLKQPEKGIVYGQGSYELCYTMKAPLNLPVFKGDFTNTNSVAPFTAWNTMAIATLPYESPDSKYRVEETNQSGVYINIPSNKGYIGDYVWEDFNANAKQDDAEYKRTTIGNRHIHSNNTIDFDGDGLLDDPGINDVKVELLTEKGYPSNCNGQAVIANPDTDQGGYFVIDETTGDYLLDDTGIKIHTNEGPQVTYTQSDYYGNQGYYILSNLEAGRYQLRFTFPEKYNGFEITTKKILEDTGVTIYQKGDVLPSLSTEFEINGNGTQAESLTIMTDSFEVKPVDLSSEAAFIQYDEKAMSADIGVARPVSYGGSIWNDNIQDIDDRYQLNGYRDQLDEMGILEQGISNITILAYEKGKEEVAIGMDGKPLEVKTNADGSYMFEMLYPNREYKFVIKDLKVADDSDKYYQATPVRLNHGKPLEETRDNDGENKKDLLGNIYVETGYFKAEYPRNDKGELLFDEQNNGIEKVSKVDIGLIILKDRVGAIGDYIWIDENRNGIQELEEKPYTDGIEIQIEAWYYNPILKEWKRVEEDWISKEQQSVISDKNGFYIFQRLPSVYDTFLDTSGKVVTEDTIGAQAYTVLLGYRPYVVTMPVDYVPTINNIGDNRELDSNLLSDGYLVPKDEFIILAQEFEENEKTISVLLKENGTEVVKYYHTQNTVNYTDYDIGLVSIQNAGVSGIVWEDTNRNGLQDREIERGIQGVEVYLEVLEHQDSLSGSAIIENLEDWTPKSMVKVDENYFVESEYPLEGISDWVEPISPDKEAYRIVSKTMTDQNGKYEFLDLPTYTVVADEKGDRKKPIRYRVRIRKPYNAKVTAYQKYKDMFVDRNSDFALLDKEGEIWDIVSDSFTLVKPLYEDIEKSDPWGNHYDYTKVCFQSHLDAGLLVNGAYAFVGDRVWKDEDKNGLQDNDEVGIEGVEVRLYRFEPEIETTTYLLNESSQVSGAAIVQGKWVACVDSYGNEMKTVTDKNGNYQFRVVAYDQDKNSKTYMQPYHYRAVVICPTDMEETILHVGMNRQIDSNAFAMKYVQNIEEISSPFDSIDKIENLEKRIHPFTTPVGNVFGIPIEDNLLVGDEFVVGNVYQVEKTEDITKVLDTMEQMRRKGEKSKPFSGVQSKIVSGSAILTPNVIISGGAIHVSHVTISGSSISIPNVVVTKGAISIPNIVISGSSLYIPNEFDKDGIQKVPNARIDGENLYLLEGTGVEDGLFIPNVKIVGNTLLLSNAKIVEGGSLIWNEKIEYQNEKIDVEFIAYIDLFTIYNDLSVDFGIKDVELELEEEPKEEIPEEPKEEIPDPETPTEEVPEVPNQGGSTEEEVPIEEDVEVPIENVPTDKNEETPKENLPTENIQDEEEEVEDNLLEEDIAEKQDTDFNNKFTTSGENNANTIHINISKPLEKNKYEKKNNGKISFVKTSDKIWVEILWVSLLLSGVIVFYFKRKNNKKNSKTK